MVEGVHQGPVLVGTFFTGLGDPSTMDRKLAHSGACIAVSESSGT